MTRILDIIAQQAQLTPEDWRQYLALRLARHFNDLARLRMYVNIFQEHSLERIHDAFALACKRSESERAGALLHRLSSLT